MLREFFDPSSKKVQDQREPQNPFLVSDNRDQMRIRMEEGTATHSRILAWGMPWTEKPGRLQFIGLQRVGHD